MSAEYSIIIAYLLVMAGMGFVFSRLSQDGSDYFRSGGKGTWWLVGISAFMAGLSARTFTGNAGVAYEAGWSVLIIYWGGALGALFQWAYFGRIYRRTRAVTLPEIIRARFGPAAQQFYSVAQMPGALLTSGIWLWGIGIFAGSALQIDTNLVVIVVGLVVLVMSSAGGSWAVMASDVVQSLIIFSIVLLMAAVTIMHVGGIGELYELLKQSEIGSSYSFIKEAGQFSNDQFTLGWAAAQVGFTVMLFCSLEGANRFLSVKDDRAANRASVLVFGLMLLLPAILFLPAWAAAALYPEQVAAAGGVKPAESAYAIAVQNLLPPEMTGMMIVAMLAATMSSMDTGLNRNSGIVVRNILPFLFKLTGRAPLSHRGEVTLGRWLSAVFGLVAISLALSYQNLSSMGMFELGLTISAILGVPLALPLLLGLFIRRTPGWAAFTSIACGIVVGMYTLLPTWWGAEPWSFQERMGVITFAGLLGFSLGIPFWSRTSESEKGRICAFFDQLATPIDFEKEIGQANDGTQARLIGLSGLILSGCFVCFLFFATSYQAALCLAWVILFVGGISGGLWYWGHRRQ